MSGRPVMAYYWLTIGVCVAVVVALPASDPVAGLVVWSLVGALATIAIVVGVLRHRPRRAWPWALLATGIVASTIADALYSLVQIGAPADLLGVANAMYFGLFVLAAVALLRFARSGSSGAEQAGLVDAITVTLVLLLLVYVTMISPARPDFTALTNPAIVAYPIGDALLFATVIRLLTTRRRTVAVLYLAAGAVASLLADVVYAIDPTGATWHAGALTDVGWLALYALWGASALHPSMARLTEPEVLPDREITARTAAVLVLTALTAPVALLVEALTGTVRDAGVLAVASGVFFVLSLSRVAAAANTHRRSVVYRDHHDTLTGLANRAYFTRQVELTRLRAGPAAVLMIDLDDFKAVNDVLGHSVGDEVLVTVAHRIARVLGRHDLGARIGGDEFAVLVVSDPSGVGVTQLGRRLATSLGEPISFAGREVKVTACIGVATTADLAPPPDDNPSITNTSITNTSITNTSITNTSGTNPTGTNDSSRSTHPAPDAVHDVDEVIEDAASEADRETEAKPESDDPATFGAVDVTGHRPVVPADDPGSEADQLGYDLIRQAGLALQAAQAKGIGQWCQYRSDVHGAIVTRMRLRAALDRAVTEGSFMLHFQPIVALDPERTVGFEALVRWEHPTRGMVPPSEFIELAEETGQIEAIGAWVLRGAIAAAAHWHRTRPDGPYISVNVSARQFRTPGFAQRVARELGDAGLPASRLMLELTESALLREEDQVWAELGALRETGVRLAIDDFGTGFSSLSYLVQTPIDVIKIDKSFVQTLATSTRHYAIINGIVRLAQQLGLQVVAEGIETDTDRDLLVRMGCRYGQGYLFSEPMTSANTDAWLDAGNAGPDSSPPSS